MSARYEKLQSDLKRSPTRWLVTGAAGFVGSHIAEKLIELGQDVVALDDFSTGERNNIRYLDARAAATGGRFEFIEGDIRNRQVCDQATRGVQYISHQAALGSVPRSLKHPEETHQVNVDGTVNILLSARASGVEGIAYASSSSVYGDHPALPKREAEIGLPLSPYALSKRVCEQYAQNYFHCFDLASIGLRYFNVVGPRQSPTGPYAAVVPRWLDALRRKEAPVIYGDGKTSRDFCPVENVVQANLLAATASRPSQGRVFNVALGGQTTLLELFSLLQELLVAKGVDCAAIKPRRTEFRPGDIRHSRADIKMAQELLGYHPTTTLRTGLTNLVEASVAAS